GGLPGFSHSISSEDGVVTSEVITAEWLGLSTDVSVVAYQLDGSFIGWQKPVGGVTSLRLDRRPEDYLAIAFDASGLELDRFGTQLEPLQPISDSTIVSPSGPTAPGVDWAPMTSEGSEIEPDEIPTDELREEVSPQAGDRLFLVPVDDDEIVVLVGRGTPHAYAQSCAVLDGVDLPPGWQETCLD
ncbi:MAG: hypothetical protein ACRDX9_06535, partial [Acidimicrobiia bacterium]